MDWHEELPVRTLWTRFVQLAKFLPSTDAETCHLLLSVRQVQDGQARLGLSILSRHRLEFCLACHLRFTRIVR